MSRLKDNITHYFNENCNLPVSVEEIASYLRGEGLSIFSDTIRRTMSEDKERFENIRVSGRNWKKWRMKPHQTKIEL